MAHQQFTDIVSKRHQWRITILLVMLGILGIAFLGGILLQVSFYSKHPAVEGMSVIWWCIVGEAILCCIFLMLIGRVVYLNTKRSKEVESSLEKRIAKLTQPLDESEGVTFDDIFNIEEIQRIQDDFATAAQVASVITYPDGRPITRPSNFCRLCKDIIRKTEKGLQNCMHSDACLGKCNPGGPIMQPCLSGGLWDGGASITVGGKHIANWLIGQVRNDTQTEEKMLAYAHQIGADEKIFLEAFREVPVMSKQRFAEICRALFTMANQLSKTAYQNLQQARFIAERKRAEKELQQANDRFNQLAEQSRTFVWEVNSYNRYTYLSPVVTTVLGYAPQELIDKYFYDLHPEQGRDDYWTEVVRIFAKRDSFHELETPVVAKNNSLVWLSISGLPVFDDREKFVGYRGSATDITERKQAENKLRATLTEAERLNRYLKEQTQYTHSVDPQDHPVSDTD